MPRTISLPKNNTAIVQDGTSDEQAIAYWKSQRPDIFLPDEPPPEPVKPEPGIASEIGSILKSGTGQGIASLGKLGQYAGIGGKDLEEYGAGMTKSATEALSPGTQAALQRQFLKEAPEGQGFLGYQLGEGKLTDIPAQFLQSVPVMAGSMAAAVGATALAPASVVAGAGTGVLGFLGRVGLSKVAGRIVTAAGPGAGAAEALAGKLAVNTLAGNVTEGLAAAGSSGIETEKAINDFAKLNPDGFFRSPIGQQALQDADGDKKKAIELGAFRAGRSAAVLTGISTALLATPGSAFESVAVFGKGAKSSRLHSAIMGGIAEGPLQELPQGSAEQYIQNLQRIQAGEEISPGKGVLEAGVQGAIIGTPMGGALGAITGSGKPQEPRSLDTQFQELANQYQSKGLNTTTAYSNAANDIEKYAQVGETLTVYDSLGKDSQDVTIVGKSDAGRAIVDVGGEEFVLGNEYTVSNPNDGRYGIKKGDEFVASSELNKDEVTSASENIEKIIKQFNAEFEQTKVKTPEHYAAERLGTALDAAKEVIEVAEKKAQEEAAKQKAPSVKPVKPAPAAAAPAAAAAPPAQTVTPAAAAQASPAPPVAPAAAAPTPAPAAAPDAAPDAAPAAAPAQTEPPVETPETSVLEDLEEPVVAVAEPIEDSLEIDEAAIDAEVAAQEAEQTKADADAITAENASKNLAKSTKAEDRAAEKAAKKVETDAFNAAEKVRRKIYNPFDRALNDLGMKNPDEGTRADPNPDHKDIKSALLKTAKKLFDLGYMDEQEYSAFTQETKTKGADLTDGIRTLRYVVESSVGKGTTPQSRVSAKESRAPKTKKGTPAAQNTLRQLLTEMRKTRNKEYYDKALPRVAALVKKRMGQLGLGKYIEEDFIKLLQAGKETNGAYFQKVINLAIAGKSDKQIMSTLDHEAIHAMRAIGMITDEEWKNLKTLVDKRGWLKTFYIQSQYDKAGKLIVEGRYENFNPTDKDLKKSGLTREQWILDSQYEEAIADAFATYANGRSPLLGYDENDQPIYRYKKDLKLAGQPVGIINRILKILGIVKDVVSEDAVFKRVIEAPIEADADKLKAESASPKLSVANIKDGNILSRIAEIEGETFVRQQEQGGSYTVKAIQDELSDLQDAGYGPEDLSNRVIYGTGGYNRYQVGEDGSVRPIKSSFDNRKDQYEKAVSVLGKRLEETSPKLSASIKNLNNIKQDFKIPAEELNKRIRDTAKEIRFFADNKDYESKVLFLNQEYVFFDDHFFFFPKGRDWDDKHPTATTSWSVYQFNTLKSNRKNEGPYNDKVEKLIPAMLRPHFKKWAEGKISIKELKSFVVNDVHNAITTKVYNDLEKQSPKLSVSKADLGREKTGQLYEVYNRKTGKVVGGPYQTRSTARSGADRNDNKYGGYAHDVREVEQKAQPKFSVAPRINTDSFKQWFGDSKVVDEDGNPLRLYRGLSDDYGPTMRVARDGSLGSGIYMTPDANFAGEYANENGGNIVPLYATLRNPLILKTESGKDPMIQALTLLGMSQAKAEQVVEKAYDEKGYISTQVKTRAVAQGYDGIMQYRNGKLAEVVAFYQNQVKSVFNENPTSSPDIRFSVAPKITKNIVKNAKGLYIYKGKLPESFYKWFGTSAVTDDDGYPLVMFHGTARDITEFKPKQANAIFITNNTNTAFNFSELSKAWVLDHLDDFITPELQKEIRVEARRVADSSNEKNKKIAFIDELDRLIGNELESGNNLIPLFVRAENIFDYENKEQVKNLVDYISGQGGLTAYAFSKNDNWETIESPAVQNAIKALGYDSFYVSENNSKNLAVYDPNQVKSVTGNSGEYSRESKDIRRSVAPRLSSDIDHKREKSTGRYVGAPDWVGNSTRKLNFLGRTLDDLAYEGRNGRYWYEKSSKAILDMVDGNKIDAEKFVGLVALFSAGNQVNSNMGMAIRAWYEWKGTGHITAGRFPATQGPKAERWLNKGEDYSGIKVNNFYLDLMEEIDPAKVDKEHSTMDMWMALAGDYGSKILDQGPKYHFMQREIKRIADNLGWKPHQAQAAIWTAIKARVESSETERKAFELKTGIANLVRKIDPETGKIGDVFEIVDGKEYAHFRTATKFGLASEITQNQIDEMYYDFSNAIRERTVQLSTEATPGVTSGVLPGIHAAPTFQKIEYLEAIRRVFTLSDGSNRLFEKLGMLAKTGGVQFSGWQGVTTVGQQNKVVVRVTGGKIESNSELLLNLAGSIYGLATNQEGVAWHYPTFQLPQTPVFGLNGIEIDVGRNLTEKQTDDLYTNLIKELGHSYSPPIPTDTGFRVINFPKEKAAYDAAKEVEKSGQLDVFNKGIIANYRKDLSKANTKFVEGVIRALDKFPYLAKSVKRFSSYGNLIENDWSNKDNDYRIQIARAVQELSDNGSKIGRSDLQEWINGVLLPEVARVNKHFSEKYEWGAAEPNQKQFKGEDFGRYSVAPRLGDRGEGREKGGRFAPLKMAPSVKSVYGPDRRIVEVAERYAEENGFSLKRQAEYVQVDSVRGKRLADAYEAMLHDPQDPVVKEAYRNLIEQTTPQYRALEAAGYRFWFIDPDIEENLNYLSSPWNAIRDLRANQEMGVFPTTSGYGTNEFDVTDNPMLAQTGIEWPNGSLEGKLKPVLANDLFRAVHDAFGHGLEGAGFRADGEENAWQAHIRMYTGSAKGAITSETRGQNSVVNFGPNAEFNRTANGADTIYADQKTGLMPKWTWTEGISKDELPSKLSVAPRLTVSPYISATGVLGGRAIPTTFAAPASSKLTDHIYTWADKFVDLKNLQAEIEKTTGQLEDQYNAYQKEELYHAKVAKQVLDFMRQEVRPLFDAMEKENITPEKLNEYLHSRHAEERNVQIDKINQGVVQGIVGKGSGITTKDARDYLNSLSAQEKASLDRVAKMLDGIMQKTRDLMVSSGLEEQGTIDAWQKTYKHYVPLERVLGDPDEENTGFTGQGQGYSVSKNVKRALGSTLDVEHIIANILATRERTIVRAEKNEVNKAIYGLALKAPNPNIWIAVDPELPKNTRKNLASFLATFGGFTLNEAQNIAAFPQTRSVDRQTGLITKGRNPQLAKADNVLHLMIDGKEKLIFFNSRNKQANRLIRTLKNLDTATVARGLQKVAVITRYFSAVNTQYNPIFGVINLIRDVQTGLINLQSTPIAGMQKQVANDFMPAIKGIWSQLRAEAKGGNGTGQWAALFKEFEQYGGPTGYRDMFANSDDRAKMIESEIKSLKQGKIKEGFSGLKSMLSDYNTAFENGVRLAAYKAALDKGLSKEKSASLAKNLTVNFNRKGDIALQAGALYAFFNASVQGTARILQTMTRIENGKLVITPLGNKIIRGGLLLGVVQAVALAAAGFDDDNPPQFVREKNIIIPLMNGKYLTIPMPLGFNLLPNLSRNVTEWGMSGFKNTPKRIISLLESVMTGLNPFGGGFSVQTLVPTVVDPLIALAENKDSFGRKIAREDFSSLRETPGYLRTKDTATPWSKGLSEFLNYASGGTKYMKGALSPTPDQIDYLIGQATGGVGREIGKISQTISSTATGEELPSTKIPLLSRFYGDTEESASQSNKYYTNLSRINSYAAEIKGRIGHPGTGTVSEFIQDVPEARLVPLATATYSAIQKIEKLKKQAIERGLPKERIRQFEKLTQDRMKQFNQRVEAFQR